jgi:hypothetical protein
MIRVVLVAALVAAALYGVRSQRVLERAGLFGSCSAVASVPSDQGWMACRSGRLSGYPSLAHDACKHVGDRDGLAYWRCPTRLVSSRAAADRPSP